MTARGEIRFGRQIGADSLLPTHFFGGKALKREELGGEGGALLKLVGARREGDLGESKGEEK